MGLFSKTYRPPTIGLFGKIRVRGDFIAMSLPRDVQTQLETWIKSGISVAKTNPNWREAYMSSPIWQFAFAPGVLGSKPWCGVMMPSVDSVGRYFPLVIAMPVSAANKSVLMEAQNLAQDSLSDAFSDVDDWLAHVRKLGKDGIDNEPERLCAAKTGAIFRVVEPSGDVGAEIRESHLMPELYTRLIGAAGHSGQPEVSLL